MTAELRDLLDTLGRDPGERTAICHGASFTAEMTTVEKAPDLAARYTEVDCWFSTQPLHERVNGTGRGKAADVVGLRELYADLDVKAGGMPGWDAAATVITDLAGLLGSAPVAVVSTGHGLQPHWAVERGPGTDWPDDTDPRWLAAQALLRRWGRLVNRVAEAHGGHVDNVYDLARVLRAPGTTNRKAAPKRTGLTPLAGTPVSLEQIRECLDAYGIRELAEDREQLGETVAEAGGWRFADRTCSYVTTMAEGWATDTPGARHPWLVGQATRLAAAHRRGCITEQDHTAALAALAARFRVVLETGDKRPESRGEIRDALAWGVTRAERMTDAKVAGELGDHQHPPQASTIGDAADADCSSWAPVDLAPYLNGQVIRPEPTIGLARSDGLRLIYPGKEHTAIGEMESGKSWLAAASVAAELTNGKRALYIHFEEADPADTIERLQALGVPNDVILTRFVFVGPAEPVTPPRLAALLRPAPSLVVLDGVNEAMSMHGQGIREEDGVAAFRRRLVKPCTAVGAATLACDHVVKDKERRGRDPLGSIHKGNGLTGSLILLENAAPFGRDLRGCSHVFVTKDRPGHLRRAGRPSKLPGKTFMGSLIVDDTRTHVGYLDLAFIEPAEQTKSETTGTRDDHDDANMLAAVADLEARGLAASLRTIRAKATGVGKDRVDNALTRLVLDGKLIERQGPRSARLFATVAVTVAEPSPSGDAP